MIPRKIHYCWLSDDPMPEKVLECIATWKEMLPDYELILWDRKKFDITKFDFVEKAYNDGMYAFACDFIRAFAVWSEGGFYLDTDVKIFKKNCLDEYLEYDFVTSIELEDPDEGIQMNPAFFGGSAGNQLCIDVMEKYQEIDYNKLDFILPFKNSAPVIYTSALNKYAYLKTDDTQVICGGRYLILSREIIAPVPNQITDNTIACHYCLSAWFYKKYWQMLDILEDDIRKKKETGESYYDSAYRLARIMYKYRGGDTNKMLSYAEYCINQNNMDPYMNYIAGLSNYLLSNDEKTVEYFIKSLCNGEELTNREKSVAHLNIGYALFRLGRPYEALYHNNESLRYNPKSETAINNDAYYKSLFLQ